ncbi:MAG: hypothetical protein WD042_17365 [Phycisphaeraceae bacterium]
MLAILFWIFGTGWAFVRIRAAMLTKRNAAIEGPLPLVRPIFRTMWASIGLAVMGFFIALLYDAITVGL